MSTRQEVAKMRKEKRASYFYDLSKLVFGTLSVGGFAPYLLGTTDSVNWMASFSGCIMSAVLAVIGDRILRQ